MGNQSEPHKEINCPSCKTLMTVEKHPDIKVDVCPRCCGVFLDHTELDALATGLQGKIEYCSIDDDFHDDRFPKRACPRCPNETMGKSNLIEFSNVIFDVCPKCHGFFLDKGEEKAMNNYLREISPSGTGDEFRGYRQGHLVRVNHVHDLISVSYGMKGAGIARTEMGNFLQVIVYFSKPLDIDLRISKEKWTAKLAKAFLLFKGNDFEVGNPEFDRSFIIEGEDQNSIKMLLSDDVQKALLAFIESKPSVFQLQGSLEVLDDRVVYTEGPYTRIEIKVDEDANEMIDRLLSIASVFEGVRA